MMTETSTMPEPTEPEIEDQVDTSGVDESDITNEPTEQEEI